jgi:hypothetical protein
MPYTNRREAGDALSDDRTWSYQVGSFYSGGSPRMVHASFPTGSFATAQRAEKRHAIKTKAVKQALAGAPAKT